MAKSEKYAEHKIARRRSKIHGNGVFAIAPIRKGEFIVRYKGKVVTHEEADKQRGGDVGSGHTFLFTLNETYLIDANRGGNVARWLNCSCDPNCVAFVHDDDSGDPKKEKVIIEALRAIKPGEELTYDYGIVLEERYTKVLKDIWACKCGSPKCTGTMLRTKG
ncbi:MAG: SET domain-containing protein-lysine N-methyltransferase [Flavobacteriales bacterium]|jgi:SET domain-containing protein|nr:SET domain-containing protein-lysine N-methyltransferase [Flavobacteriales bacterium]MBK7268898.1 SET domain-containing protein-lysine N-methyltransferase [Flavobacteriales bacterium]MBK7752206.1 SET domain-containing protein-lysine N-methyltransferase [Flavobacteriales bacterium]MBK9074310.1 SET domain-containing protein-lysine N-methyltransferase [Flavobacteriales bacterium]MBK9537845.1 SET domain-containing protein-lysine N-methyltransferase [Flavobacteriales bacterium]